LNNLSTQYANWYGVPGFGTRHGVIARSDSDEAISTQQHAGNVKARLLRFARKD